MTQDTKDQIANLERQKIVLADRLEHLSYTDNLVKMVAIESEIFEIEDTIKKLTAQNIGFQVVDRTQAHVIIKYKKGYKESRNDIKRTIFGKASSRFV